MGAVTVDMLAPRTTTLPTLGLLGLVAPAQSLDNGLALTPVMGWSERPRPALPTPAATLSPARSQEHLGPLPMLRRGAGRQAPAGRTRPPLQRRHG